jgi:hypothetical protein
VGHTPPQPSYLSTSPSDGLLHLLSAAKLLEEGETKAAAAEQFQFQHQYSGDETESDTDAKGDRALPVPASAPFAIPKPRHS